MAQNGLPRRIRNLALALAAVMLVFGCGLLMGRLPGREPVLAGAAQPAGSTLSTARLALAQALDRYVDGYARRDRFSGSVLVAHRGHILLKKGYGLANREHGIPNAPETKFRLGSLCKQFTGAAIVHLQQRGLLHVGDPVSTYLPDYPGGDEFTVHQLLNHTAGIPEFVTGFDKRTPVTLDETIALFEARPLDFPPGERFAYSNSGYLLLTKIVEQVSGQTYGAYVRDHFFTPLGMADSGYERHEDILPGRAAGYATDGERVVNAAFVDMSFAGGAGALYSTVEDLYRWERALHGDAVLSQASREALWAPTVLVEDYADSLAYGGHAPMHYGYGWTVDEHLGRRRIWHGGGISGFVTTLARYPDDDLAVIVLCNLEDAPIDAIGDDLAAMVLADGGRRTDDDR
jgi:CubicO group peptidase (beta-lactamase class C family)